jgi:hypothetical protein
MRAWRAYFALFFNTRRALSFESIFFQHNLRDGKPAHLPLYTKHSIYGGIAHKIYCSANAVTFK